ncbi:hypothetical protein ZOD2009_17915 [Haladaptatus paucihalophilus DX253]|uniref:Uncharacterized protein n=1 Tax=Haladaptatus paucihalophilus DX253 TaxID=797209 RepID=E7QXP4_HALPU|nr:hypothetical protein ZOD2009_17915 [Haladaptatus paucihalophilus DX253]
MFRFRYLCSDFARLVISTFDAAGVGTYRVAKRADW